MALAGTMNTTQKMPFTFAPDQPLDGPLTSVVEGDATVTVDDPETGLTGFIVSGETAGADVVVTFTGDGELGPGVAHLQEVVTITITAPNATTLGGTLGTPVPKEEINPLSKAKKK
jgi:hypothetical protein